MDVELTWEDEQLKLNDRCMHASLGPEFTQARLLKRVADLLVKMSCQIETIEKKIGDIESYGRKNLE